MFTGIIERLGTIKSIRPFGQGRRIGVETDFLLDKTKIGDSIAVNGACLTAVSLSDHYFEADLSPETLSVSCMNKIHVGERVNIERALQTGWTAISCQVISTGQAKLPPETRQAMPF